MEARPAAHTVMSYVYVLCSILLTVYAQMAIKAQVLAAGRLPAGVGDKILFLGGLFLTPWVISGLAAAMLALLSWMAAMTRLQLSQAYPFMSLAFILVMAGSAVFFSEPITPLKLTGVLVVMIGVTILSQG